MESDNSSINEKRSMNGHADHPLEKPHIDTTNVDVAAELTAGKDFVLDPAEAARVRYVALHTLLPAVCRARETRAETKNGLHCVGGRSTGT